MTSFSTRRVRFVLALVVGAPCFWNFSYSEELTPEDYHCIDEVGSALNALIDVNSKIALTDTQTRHDLARAEEKFKRKGTVGKFLSFVESVDGKEALARLDALAEAYAKYSSIASVQLSQSKSYRKRASAAIASLKIESERLAEQLTEELGIEFRVRHIKDKSNIDRSRLVKHRFNIVTDTDPNLLVTTAIVYRRDKGYEFQSVAPVPARWERYGEIETGFAARGKVKATYWVRIEGELTDRNLISYTTAVRGSGTSVTHSRDGTSSVSYPDRDKLMKEKKARERTYGSCKARSTPAVKKMSDHEILAIAKRRGLKKAK